MLSGLASEDPPDAVASSELAEVTRRTISKRKLKVRTAIFLTAGWAIISEVSEGVFSTDIGKKLRTPAGSPAWNYNQPGKLPHALVSLRTSCRASATRKEEYGQYSEGRTTTVLPQISGSATDTIINGIGAFHGTTEYLRFRSAP